MRLIVDTNQADPIRLTYKGLEKGKYPTLVIPYLVWSELLEGKDAEKRRRALEKFPRLYGMEIGRVLDELAKRSESQIHSFVPVYPEKSDVHERIASTFLHPTPGQVAEARNVREGSRKHRKRMLNEFPDLNKKHKNQETAAKSRGESVENVEWDNIHDAENDLFLGKNAPYRKWLIEEVKRDANGERRQIAAKSGDAMFDAAWENQAIRRFLKLQALVNLGYAQKVWGDSRLNRLPSEKHDDQPDISLALYARKGDTILTADNPIKYRIRHVDADQDINLLTWDEWLETQTH